MKVAGISLQERIHTLDIIRGFALFGILLANMLFFKTMAMSGGDGGRIWMTLPGMESTLDQWVSFFLAFFVEGRFYPMFSLLFGLGFSIFSERLLAKKLSAQSLFIQRLLFLLMIGLLHLFFVWTGDILYTYAVTGFFLPLFFQRKASTLLYWIAGLLCFAFLLMFGAGYLMSAMPEQMVLPEQGAVIMSTGTYIEILQYRFWHESLLFLFAMPIMMVPSVLPLFLIGLYMGKTRMFHDVQANLRRWRVLAISAACAWLPLTALSVALLYDVFTLDEALAYGFVSMFHSMSGIALMLLYVSLFVLLLQKDWLQKLLMPLASTGRMALTNYLMQSFISTTIFYGYGFGLFGTVSSSQGMLIACVIFACQVVISHLYLKKFKQGPMEALWRKWTYRRA